MDNQGNNFNIPPPENQSSQPPPLYPPPQYPPPQYPPPQYPPPQQHFGPIPGRGKAIASLILGIIAMTVPIPVLDIIAGVIGLVLALQSKSEGFTGGVRTAGFVCSIIGTIWAIIYTIMFFTVGSLFFQGIDMFLTQTPF
jgi:hypothetical protein